MDDKKFPLPLIYVYYQEIEVLKDKILKKLKNKKNNKIKLLIFFILFT
jgi:hypothetical protein